jgi:CRP-like cAMP-binding protein
LYARISALAAVPESEWLLAEALGREESLPKRGRFLSAGDAADRFAFVLKGLFRAYRVSADGVESVKAFRAEGELLGAYAEMLQGLASLTYVEALEPSTILVFRARDFEALEAGHPSWIMLARRVAEHHFVLKERREQEFLELDAEGRLARFWEEHPHLADRVTQAEVAAYLGITPVALSRIVSRRRKRRSSTEDVS